jgi:penicillin G amidase
MRQTEQSGKTRVVIPVRPQRRSRLLRYSLFSLGGLVVVLLLLSGFLLFWLVLRPLPTTSGNLQIAGLSAEVKVVRDKSGVPHIYASNTADLFIAQGYVTAQDRLWQLEFNRRIGAGRLSEVLGDAAIKQDRFLRTIGLRRAASAEVADLSPDERLALESYAKGINDFIDTHQDNLPIEFSLLGFKPEPWTIVDSLTWGKVMAYDLSGNYTREILRADLVEKLGAAQAGALLPTNPASGTPLIVPTGVSYANMDQNLALLDSQAELAGLGAGDPAGRGSNNWVVSGSKTTTGKPLLANDPHLGLTNPSIWYQVELNGAGWHVAGMTFPGIPGVVAGHNERIAWGVTNVGGDTQDMFMEKINPNNPDQYEYQGQWQDIQVLNEEIKIKGKPSENLKVQITRHGPIMNAVQSSIQSNSQPLALQWTALGKSPILGAVLKYDRAQNWQEFRAALRDFNTPAQNFVYADIDGNIGYQIPGLWPIRAKGDGLLPVPGWTGEYDWKGFVPFEQLPSVYNPTTGFIATANQRPVPNTPQLYLGEEFDPGWRAERITQLLQAKPQLSLQDLGAIQNDVLTIPGKEFASYLGKLSDSDPKLGEAIRRIRDWDGRLTTDSVAGALYKVTYQNVLENMFKQRLGNVYEYYADEPRFHMPYLLNLLKDPTNEWWGTGGRDAMLQKALGQAIDYLSGQFGSNQNDWRWGRLHTISFPENPIGSAVPFPLNALLNLKTMERGGDASTVAAASYDFNEPYKQTAGQSFRSLMNLANFDDSLIVNTVGQSGQPFSKHYGDNLDDWNGGRWHSFPFSSGAVDQQKDEVLTLTPK